MFNFTTKSEYVLGIAASMQKVEAVLLHTSPTGPEIIRTFSRTRNGFDSSDFSAAPEFPEMDSDVSFSMGEDTPMDSSLFLDSEFANLDDGLESAPEVEIMHSGLQAVSCNLEIQDILSECNDAGYEHVRVVFALPSEFLGTSVVSVDGKAAKGSSESKKSRKKSSGSKKSDLLNQLALTHATKFQDDKTSFLKMGGEEDAAPEFLAVFALNSEPINLSVNNIRSLKRPFPNISFMDHEVSLLHGFVKAMQLSSHSEPVQESEISVLIRLGAEDTIVMFYKDDQLMHFESMRSVTAFDPPGTICSRILLMHDEFGSGDAQRMFLFSDTGETTMYQQLSQFFPNTKIQLLRDVLPPLVEEQAKPFNKEAILATGAALRLAGDELFDVVFEEVDFMDPKLKGKKIQLPFSWPVAAMIILLFGSTLFFVQRYFSQSHQLEMTRYELKNFPDETISEDGDVLQAKIDSMRMQSTRFVESLDLLDSLLIGSDVWSRALERTSVHTADISGLWIERWIESKDGVLTISGTTIDRNQAVEFAARSGANIESLEYSKIRDFPVYTFEMELLLERKLPEAALYLRERQYELDEALISDLSGTAPTLSS